MRVAIFACGGLAKVITQALVLGKQHKIIGFFDDVKKGKFGAYPILGKCVDYAGICRKNKIDGVIIAFGYKFLEQRLSFYEKVQKTKGLKLINAIHPQAVISDDVSLGSGIFIGPGVIINPGTRIADNTAIWSGSIIEHDNIIGKNVFITPGVKTSGYVSIGDNTFIGLGANITQAKIGANVTVCAGSLVLKDIGPNQYVMGIPAKVIKVKKKLGYV